MGNIVSGNPSKSHKKTKSKQKPKISLGNNKKRIKSYRDSSVSSTPTSYSSESPQHRYIDGRRYNENSKYALPNDDGEIDRLQLQHYLQRYICQGNYCSPVHRTLKRTGAKVLDVGCGPGTWLLEVAFEYPNAHFTGIDISPMYPKEIKPANVDFEEADLTTGLPFPDNTFDFVVMRNMITALSVNDWENALKELERVCKPGGFIECLEFEIPALNIGKFTKRLAEAYIQIMRTKNVDLSIAPRLEGMFTRCTELTNVEHKVKIVPIGKWGGRVGGIMAEDLTLVVKALAPTLIPLWGIGANQYQEYLKAISKELDEGKPYCNLHTIFAQKYEPYSFF